VQIVNIKFINTCVLHSFSCRKTANGGRKIARIIKIILSTAIWSGFVCSLEFEIWECMFHYL